MTPVRPTRLSGLEPLVITPDLLSFHAVPSYTFPASIVR